MRFSTRDQATIPFILYLFPPILLDKPSRHSIEFASPYYRLLFTPYRLTPWLAVLCDLPNIVSGPTRPKGELQLIVHFLYRTRLWTVDEEGPINPVVFTPRLVLTLVNRSNATITYESPRMPGTRI